MLGSASIFFRDCYNPMLILQNHRIMNQNHVYDATEIFRTLEPHKKEVFIKLGFYLLCFFYYLYWSVYRSLII